MPRNSYCEQLLTLGSGRSPPAVLICRTGHSSARAELTGHGIVQHSICNVPVFLQKTKAMEIQESDDKRMINNTRQYHLLATGTVSQSVSQSVRTHKLKG